MNKNITALIITASLAFSTALAVKDAQFRQYYSPVASSAISALVKLSKDKPDKKG